MRLEGMIQNSQTDKRGSAMTQLHTRQLGSQELLNDTRLVSQPFSEADIIELHNRFITPGFHSLKVKNEKEGRALIQTVLASLNFHHSISCLTVSSNQLESFTHNIYKTLNEFGQISEQTIFNYFLDEFESDFLWIEMSKDLMAQSWFADFELALHDFNMDQYVPIVLLSYEQ